MEKRMDMRDFVRKMKNDIDVYNNVTDEEGICYCPPIEFTTKGEEHFGWTLDNVFLNVDEDNQWAEVICDEGDYPWQLIKCGTRPLAKQFGVSRSTIQVIVNPAIKQRQHDYVKEYWRDYRPSKEEWAETMKEHRHYKQELYLKGELKDE